MFQNRIGGTAGAVVTARRATEAARTAPKEVALGVGEKAAREGARAAPKPPGSHFEAETPKKGPRLAPDTLAPASTLLTENSRDGEVNCLDLAADWVEKAGPELRARSELVFLSDARTGTEGQTGHVVVRQGERVFDPTTGKSYENLDALRREQPHYARAGTLPATQAARIFAAEPGSPARAEAIARAQVPAGLQQMLVADARASASGGTARTSTPRGLDPRSVKQAEADFKTLGKYPAMGQPNAALKMLQAHAGDADYQAHLIGLMGKGGPNSLLNNVVAGFGGLFVKSGAGEFGGTLAMRQTFLEALKHARAEGTFTAADLQAGLSRAPAPWGEVKKALGASTVTRAANADAAVKSLTQATRAYEAAKADAVKLDEELARQLSGLGQALTEQQRARYIQAFQAHPRHKSAYDALTKATVALASTVQKNEKALFNAAVTRPDSDAKALNKALELLATSGKATVAAEVAGHILRDPSSTLAQTFKAFPEFESKVAQASIPNAAVEILSQLDKPEAALARMQTLLEPFKLGLADTTGSRGDFDQGLAAYREVVQTGKFDRLNQLVDDWETSGGWAKSLGMAAVAFGAVAATNAGREGEYDTMLKELAGAGKGGLTLLAGATESLARAGAFARFGTEAGANATRFASFATRMAPALGLVASATSFGLRLGDLKDDASAGKVVAILGDTLGVLGGVVELVPGGQPVGLVVNGIAAGITALGEGIDLLAKSAESQAQRREFLDKAGVKDPLRQTLLSADRERLKEFIDELKMSPAQVQDLARKNPALLTYGSNKGLSLDNFVRMAKDFKLTGKEAYELLSTMGAGHANPAHSTHVVLSGLMRQGAGRDTKAEWLALLGQLRQGLPAEHHTTLNALERKLRGKGRTS
jgi:hypothetical protein